MIFNGREEIPHGTKRGTMKARLRKKKFKKLCARIAERMKVLELKTITIDKSKLYEA